LGKRQGWGEVGGWVAEGQCTKVPKRKKGNHEPGKKQIFSRNLNYILGWGPKGEPMGKKERRPGRNGMQALA